ncbi:MAG: response regulator [Planctomycetes bacterium]|nr:response regulator [Planctomycetota bacterium]
MTPLVLLAEDNAGDVDLLQLAFSEAGVPIEFDVARDGRSALSRLQHAAEHGGGGYALILLDLNLPGVGGIELLGFAKAQPTLHAIPVVIMTSSDHPRDRERALAGGADAYHLKPFGFAGYAPIIAQLVRSLPG